jgi:hypothetical protein
MDADMFPTGNHIFLRFAHIGSNDNLPLPLEVLSKFNHPINIADQGILFGLSGFKKFSHTRETSRDVFCLGRLARDLHDDVAGFHHISFGDENIRSNRQKITSLRDGSRKIHRPALLILDGDSWPQFRIF